MRSDSVCKHKDTRPNGEMGLTEDEGEESACVAVSCQLGFKRNSILTQRCSCNPVPLPGVQSLTLEPQKALNNLLRA